MVKRNRNHNNNNSNNSCSICFEEISENQNLVRTPCSNAGHRFHTSCLAKWFRTKGGASCPICRRNLMNIRNSVLNQSPANMKQIRTLTQRFNTHNTNRAELVNERARQMRSLHNHREGTTPWRWVFDRIQVLDQALLAQRQQQREAPRMSANATSIAQHTLRGVDDAIRYMRNQRLSGRDLTAYVDTLPPDVKDMITRLIRQRRAQSVSRR